MRLNLATISSSLVSSVAGSFAAYWRRDDHLKDSTVAALMRLTAQTSGLGHLGSTY